MAVAVVLPQVHMAQRGCACAHVLASQSNEFSQSNQGACSQVSWALTFPPRCVIVERVLGCICCTSLSVILGCSAVCSAAHQLQIRDIFWSVFGRLLQTRELHAPPSKPTPESFLLCSFFRTLRFSLSMHVKPFFALHQAVCSPCLLPVLRAY
eukprot:1139927-Pelagomonas_calceolata.AAC.13